MSIWTLRKNILSMLFMLGILIRNSERKILCSFDFFLSSRNLILSKRKIRIERTFFNPASEKIYRWIHQEFLCLICNEVAIDRKSQKSSRKGIRKYFGVKKKRFVLLL